MLYLQEFEILDDDGMFVALPFDFDGGTQGATFEEACEMALDWLRTELEQRAICGERLPRYTIGNEPREGGRIVLLGTDAGIESVRGVLPSEAARMLGVTPGRITQMVSAGQLQPFCRGGRTLITLDSVEARAAAAPKSGRPRKQQLA